MASRLHLEDCEDSSWTTISVGDDLGYESSLAAEGPQGTNEYECDKMGLDDTLPLENFEEIDHVQETKNVNCLPNINSASQKLSSRAKSDIPCKFGFTAPSACSPVFSSFPKQSGAAEPKKESFDFNPPYCSSRLGSQFSHNGGFPVLSQALSFNPPISSTLLSQKSDHVALQTCESGGISSFKPTYNSTCFRQLSDNIDFKPLRCSSALNGSSFTAEFKPNRCSSALQESSSDFLPLRSSTGLKDSNNFNPPMSSTAVQINESDIPEFRDLNVCCDNHHG